MNVLSLFDGMSCGQQALERCGIKVDNYFASEVDKYAIQITMNNYPSTIQLGDVRNIKGSDLPKIDLLIGGSPCQSFSFAGKRVGMSTKDNQEITTLDMYLELKEEGFEFEGQSYLFWEYMRLMKETNPTYFLLENVMMVKKWKDVLSRAIGIQPIMINSSLLTAQNRKRLYWTNINAIASPIDTMLDCGISIPEDKGILLKDILEEEVDDKYFLSPTMIAGFEKNLERHSEKGNGFKFKPKTGEEKGNTLRANGALCPTDNMVFNNKRLNQTIEKHAGNLEHGTLIDSYNQSIHKDKSITISTRVNASNNTHIVHNLQKRGDDRPSLLKNKNAGGSGHLSRLDGKTYCLDTANSQAVEVVGCDYRSDEGFRYRKNGKSGTLAARARNDESCGQLASVNSNIRRLTPIECERLQGVKDDYTKGVSNTQRYKMIGNGWTIPVIEHIFNHLPKEYFMQEENVTFDELISNVYQWAKAKDLLKPENAPKQFMKCIEEFGETASAINKHQYDQIKDGLGDTFVTLIILCLQLGLTPQEGLSSAWNEIKNRTGKTINGVFIKDEESKN